MSHTVGAEEEQVDNENCMTMTMKIMSMMTRVLFGRRPRPQGGGPRLQKIRNFWGIKLQIFGAEGAEIFEKLRFSMKKWLFFEVLSENLVKF